MLEFCDGELEETNKFVFGEEVITPNGFGRICELDGEDKEYCVYDKNGYLGWFKAEDLQKYVN